MIIANCRRSRSRSVVIAILALVMAGLAALFGLTDIPQRFGFDAKVVFNRNASSDEPNADDHDLDEHTHDDHGHDDHAHDEHGDEGHDDHAHAAHDDSQFSLAAKPRPTWGFGFAR